MTVLLFTDLLNQLWILCTSQMKVVFFTDWVYLYLKNHNKHTSLTLNMNMNVRHWAATVNPNTASRFNWSTGGAFKSSISLTRMEALAVHRMVNRMVSVTLMRLHLFPYLCDFSFNSSRIRGWVMRDKSFRRMILCNKQELLSCERVNRRVKYRDVGKKNRKYPNIGKKI